MAISVGDHLPEATLRRLGKEGPEALAVSSLTRGRNVVIFGLPGAFTSTCTMAHVPSFMRTRAAFAARGVDEVICVSVNDVFVMQAWGLSTGAAEAGITMLADPQGEFTRALGMEFTAEITGLIGRCKRFSLYAVDGVVKVFHPETGKGTCDISGGEALLAAIG